MTRRGLLSLALLLLTAAGPPTDRVAALSRGINITGWFRFPATRDPGALSAWMNDRAMAGLHRAGFTFVRLAVDPDVADSPGVRAVLLDGIRRMQRQGLAVVVAPHPNGWSLDGRPEDRDRLIAFWRELARALRGFPPGSTFPEVVNEPVFQGAGPLWWATQHQVLSAIRASLPDATVVLTGHDWGSIKGLEALPPESDPNVVYSFHFYDPPELTTLAAWRPGLDQAALARLPFPRPSAAACETASFGSDRTTGDLIRFYCAYNWDEARVRDRILAAAKWARDHHAVLLAGEFGATVRLNPASRAAWLRLVRETFAANHIGWALWGYDDEMGFNVPRPPPAEPVLDRSVLASLGLTGP